MLVIQEVIRDVAADRYVATTVNEAPESVTALNIADHCRQVYGTPLDRVLIAPDGAAPRTIGWVFALPQKLAEHFGLADGELLVVPQVRTEHGYRPLFEVLHDQQRVLEGLHRDGRIDHVIRISPDQPWEAASRADSAPSAYEELDSEPPIDFEAILPPHDHTDYFDDEGDIDDDLADLSDLIAEQRPAEALEMADEMVSPELRMYPQQLAATCRLRGDALSDLGRLDEALASYADARSLFVAEEDEEGIADVDMELGITLERIGRPVEARGRYEAALAFYREAEDEGSTARCLLNMSSCLRRLGEGDTAARDLEIAREITARLGLRREHLDASFNLANLRWDQGQLVAARDWYATARADYLAIGLPAQAADCDDSLGSVLHEFGEVERAIELHRAALAVYLDHGLDPETALARSNLGHALDHLGDTEGAREELELASAMYAGMGADGSVATCRLLLAWVAVHAGETTEAFALLAAARDLSRESGTTSSLPYLNHCTGVALLTDGRHAEAVTVLETAVAGLDAHGDPKCAADAQLDLATALLGTDEAEPAARQVLRARATYERMHLTNRVAECDAHPALAAV